MKFSLSTLLFLVLVASIGCAALINANEIWRQSMLTLVVSALLIATLAAAVDRSRSFALGFAVAGWIYLLMVFVPVFDLRDDLLTDKAVRWLFEAIHDEDVHASWVGSVAFTPDGRILTTASQDRTVTLWNARTGAQIKPQFENFADIGHALWLLIVACLGGAVAGVLARGRETGLSELR